MNEGEVMLSRIFKAWDNGMERTNGALLPFILLAIVLLIIVLVNL